MNRELLEKAFGPEQIKTREGSFGKTLEYVEAHSVIQRLNDAFDGEWSFQIVEQKVLEQTDEVLILGQLKTGDIVKSQFGSTKITRSRQSGEMVSIADDFKAAATDALKKCATMFGVGLHLYGGGNGRSQGNGNGYYPERNFGNGNGGNGGNGNSRLSSKQYQYLQRLNADLGKTAQDLDQQSLAMFGTVTEHLNRRDASQLIADLLRA